ncbi:MAG: hypothetical protein H6753_04980 [Candidatus Omnitrophica bacterium]|nr:hypothetical protein [Candidatus Omnitrophota bacterium]
MTTTFTKMLWDENTQKKFVIMIGKIPMFHREIARQVVEKKAQINAQARGSAYVEDVDITDAFFSEVPKAFYSLMIRILDEAGLNYDRHIKKQIKG